MTDYDLRARGSVKLLAPVDFLRPLCTLSVTLLKGITHNAKRCEVKMAITV